MTKREFDEFRESDCPCGRGQVTRHVESTDYRFTSVHTSYSLDCLACQSIWRLDHGTLVKRESELPYLDAKEDSDSLRLSLYQLSQELVRLYCESQTFKSKKAELELLQGLNICDDNYAYYTKSRRLGKQMHEMAYGQRNMEWLLDIASFYGKSDLLSSLMNASQEATSRADALYKHIVRIPFKAVLTRT